MPHFEYFEHTADVGLRIQAGQLDELFRSAAEGLMAYVVANLDQVRELSRESLSLEADNPSDLLLAWLNELIFRLETSHTLYSRFQVDLHESGRSLQAVLWGEAIDPDRHILDHEVKAATHHGTLLAHNGSNWQAEVILDI